MSERRAWIALIPLLAGSYAGTVSNTVVNAPMNLIREDLGASLGATSLVAIAFTMTLAVLMPLSGWLGDRFGRRRVFAISMGTMALASAGAALAPGLTALVFFRALQGASSAAVLPTVMGLIGDTIGERHRGRAVGLWAAVNGIGQASGPVLGGGLATWLGWRSIFWAVVPLALFAFAATLRLVPHDPAKPIGFDWRGAALITLAAALGLGGVAGVAPLGLGSPVVWGGLALGLASALAFVLVERGRAEPFVRPRALLESRYLRSCAAVFAQMFGLGACLLVVPLYLTGVDGRTAAVAGLAVLVVPVAMATLAPFVGLVIERGFPRLALRGGLVVMIVGQATAAVALAEGVSIGPALLGSLLLVGVGIAFVQTSATTGATRSELGRKGTGLGVFNLVRFSGTAMGAAWTAVAIDGLSSYSLVFTGSAAMAAAGLLMAFAGPSQPPIRS